LPFWHAGRRRRENRSKTRRIRLLLIEVFLKARLFRKRTLNRLVPVSGKSFPRVRETLGKLF
jgi:hypothetical protein